MPIFYQSVIAEHQYVRSDVGIFDVSHMGEIWIKGPDALPFLEELTINSVAKLAPGQGQYSAMCNEDGGVVDDLLIYCLAPSEYLLCVNAANIEKDHAWLLKHKKKTVNVTIENRSAQFGQLAVQGPKSQTLLLKLFSEQKSKDQLAALSYGSIAEFALEDFFVYIARTGYTGEVGYEIYVPEKKLTALWDKLFAIDEPKAWPIGLGARDTLRLEAGFILYGHEATDQVSPLEAGISWAFKGQDKNFIGKEPALAKKAAGQNRKLVSFVMAEQGIARADMQVFHQQKPCGVVTSGSFLPSLQKAGGMALVSGTCKEGDELEIDIRGQLKKALIVKKPLYDSKIKTI